MQICQLEFQSNFHIVEGNDRSQAAVMVLAQGDSTGGPDNRHSHSDQWLYVVSGEGEAIVEQRRQRLQPRTLLLVERKEAHEITNTTSRRTIHSSNAMKRVAKSTRTVFATYGG